MAVLHSRTFRFERAEWYQAWVANYEDIWKFEGALQTIWGRSRVKIQMRAYDALDVTFIDLSERTAEALVRSVHDALRAPLPPDANALDVVGDILHEGP